MKKILEKIKCEWYFYVYIYIYIGRMFFKTDWFWLMFVNKYDIYIRKKEKKLKCIQKE